MRKLGFLSVLFILSGCKVEVTTPDSGTVETLSGQYSCTAEAPCALDISDFYFNEVFVPVAEPGQAFIGWTRGEGTLCGGGYGVCKVSTEGHESNEFAADLFNSDELLTIRPQFADHDRRAFEGQWFGELLGSLGGRTTEDERVWIEIDGESISIVEQRWSERSECEYQGSFDATPMNASFAKEAISGDFNCSSSEPVFGEFTGYIYAVTDHQTIIEFHTVAADGTERSTVSVLHRDEFYLTDIEHVAAEVMGSEYSSEFQGTYEGNQVKGGTRCAAFPAGHSFATFEINQSNPLMVINTTVNSSEDCVFTQDNYNKLQGRFQCNDSTVGVWKADLPKIHKTPQGNVISMEITRFGQACSILHLTGWEKGTIR